MAEEVKEQDILQAKIAIERLKFRRRALAIGALPALIALMIYSMRIGVADISLLQTLKIIAARWIDFPEAISPKHETIIWVLRIPRVLVAAVAGATLGMSACVTQAILKNHLASPYTLGVSSSAAFGAALGMILKIGFFEGVWAIIANSFIFSLLPALVIFFANKKRVLSGEGIILCGVAISFVFSSLNTLLQFVAEDDALRNSLFWTVGDLTRAALWQLPYLLAAMLLFFVLAFWLASRINIIKMGDDDARAMGVNVEKIKIVSIIAACLATASVICFTGSIGFVGLLAPHIGRLIIGGDERYLIPVSALLGALLLIIADIVAKSFFAPVILPVGAVTALIGGPVLVYFLLRSKS
ncbi:MAG: iron ABC transporter permease [Brachymonas sp.]|nr:iron ABC transporter permease [Brachymonas sp.]